MDKYVSELDTKRFGFKVAKINDFNEDIEDLIKRIKNSGIRLVISRVNSSQIQLINKLEDLGFRLKDTQMLLNHNLQEIERFIIDNKKENRFILREPRPEEAEKIGKLAGESFDGYGHYSENKMLPIEKLVEIYSDWAYKSCIDKNVADRVIIAEVKNRIVGFTSVKYHYNSVNPHSYLNVGAVSKEFRNMGIFRAIIKQCLIISKNDNMSWSDTKILTTNIAVNRSLNDLGFKINGSEHTLHCWL